VAGERPVFYLGAGGERDRVWLQTDAAAHGQAMAAATATMLASLVGGTPNRYRPLLLGRARLAIGAPAARDGWTPALAAAPPAPPVLDAGALGLTPDLLRAMDAFKPTLVVHLQDWAGEEGSPTGLAGAGLRVVESFHLAPELHRRLDGIGEGGERLRTWLGRPSALARDLAAHPDARTGARARQHVARLGHGVFAVGAEAQARRGDPSWPAVSRLAPGRYVPRLEWRRLGAASLGELALSRYGALALCGQLFDQPVAERAGAAIALAEAAILYRLGLETGEASVR
jgi:hypothetical protein